MEVGFQEDHCTGQQHNGFEVLFFVFMADDAAAVIEQPGKEALYFPSSFVAPEFAAVLCFWFDATRSVRCDHFHTDHRQTLIQGVTIIRSITNELFWQFIDKSVLQGLFH